MGLDGPGTDTEPRSNLAAGLSFADQPQDLPLPCGEAVIRRRDRDFRSMQVQFDRML